MVRARVTIELEPDDSYPYKQPKNKRRVYRGGGGRERESPKGEGGAGTKLEGLQRK